jgi:CBS-domain-containing membrane protein
VRRFHLIDVSFRRDPGHFVLQSLLAFVAIAGVVLAMGALTNGAIVAALGASAFIVFATPAHKTAWPRSLIGGHLLCMAIGAICSLPLRLALLPSTAVAQGLLGAAAASLALFGMVTTDTEHPPAAGNALAFAVTPIGIEHALFTLGTVVLLAVVRRALRGWLKDLT